MTCPRSHSLLGWVHIETGLHDPSHLLLGQVPHSSASHTKVRSAEKAARKKPQGTDRKGRRVEEGRGGGVIR